MRFVILVGALVLGCGGGDDSGLEVASSGQLGDRCDSKSECIEAIKVEQETNGNALCQTTLLSLDAGVCMFSCDLLLDPYTPIPAAEEKCVTLGGECRYPASVPPRTCQF